MQAPDPTPVNRRVDLRQSGETQRTSVRRVVGAGAGPALIVAAVLVVLHRFAFSGMVSSQYPDVLPFWLPTYCFLGHSLAAGHIPAWNPHVMAGVPFAADPQSGWMYLPAMLLFSVLPCHVAIRWYVVLQPMLGGLGIYAFARAEGLSRPAAAAGGLTLALALAGSYEVLNLPFAATLAWSSLLLAAGARFFHAATWRARLGWLMAVALAWGQLASVNLTDGVVLGSGALVLYAIVRETVEHRAGRRTVGLSIGLLALLLLAVPLVNAAVLLPRLAYLPRTSLGLGYTRLGQLSAALRGKPTSGLVYGKGTAPDWPLGLTLSPGMHVAAVGLALAFAGWWGRGRRPLVLAFSTFGAISYILMLNATARVLGPHVRSTKAGGAYLHDPSRFRFGLILAIAVLVAVGVEAWRDAPSWRRRMVMLSPGLVVWGLLPPVFGAPVAALRLAALGALSGGIALGLSAWRPALLAIVPAVVAAEVALTGLGGQTRIPGISFRPSSNGGGIEPLATLTPATISAADLMMEGPIARALTSRDRGRYLSLDPQEWDPRGYHLHQDPSAWGLLAMQQSMYFGLQEAQGYNPAQLLPYWSFVRAADPKTIRYNAAFFVRPPPVALDLLQVGWIVGRAGRPPPPVSGEAPLVTEGRWGLYSVPGAPARASVLTSWQVVPSNAAARARILSAGFDPNRTVVLEGPPGVRPSGRPPAPGTAVYRALGLQSAIADVEAPGPAVVLIRNSFDRGWRATVDGHPTPILVGDSMLQAVPVPQGRHTVRLAYHDPTIGSGLLASAVTLVGLIGAIATMGRRKPHPPAPGTGGSTSSKHDPEGHIVVQGGVVGGDVPGHGPTGRGLDGGATR